MFISELFDRTKRAHRGGIDLEAWKDGLEFQINATSQGIDLGRVVFDVQFQGKDTILIAKDLMILPKYRGQGIAAIMYDYAKELGYKVERSSEQTDAGKHFWDKNRGEEGQMWESKTLDPDVYGEELPIATVKRIVAGVMNQVDPTAKVSIKQTPEGYYSVNSEKLRLDFGITADGGEINANIVNAYSSYKGAGVVTEIFKQCFQAAEQLWGKPAKFVMSAHEDRGHGVWQHIAQKLGAEWAGSISEISDELRRNYLHGAGKVVDRRMSHMARVRDRLNKGYEIYHADRPAGPKQIVDQFDADTPALARQYYEKFIQDYVSDVDFDLRLRRATGIMEVTMVPTVAKSKREHLDVMPNDGRPIPKGEEAEHLGDLVAEMGNGLQLWSWVDRGTTTYYVFDTNTRTSQLGTTGRAYPDNRNSFVIQGVYSGPQNKYRAADLYAFLIINRGLTLVSDNKQSEGGYRVWQELERRYGRKLNIHGFDTKTNEPVNVTTQDEPETHVARSDIKKAGPQMKRELGTISRDLRFVASAR